MINGFVDFDITEVDGGYDIEGAVREYHIAYFEAHDNGFTLKLRETALPSIGSRQMVGGRAVKVKSREFDSSGHVFIVDESTGEKLRWA